MGDPLLHRDPRRPHRRTAEEPLSGLPELETFGVDTFTSAGRLARHRHPGGFEFVFLVRGRVFWAAGGKRYEVRGGDLFVTPPDLWHGGLKGVMHPCFLYWLIVRAPRPAAERQRHRGGRSNRDGGRSAGPTFLSLPPREAEALCAGLYALRGPVFHGARRLEHLPRRMEKLLSAGEPHLAPALRATLVLFLTEVLALAAESRAGAGAGAASTAFLFKEKNRGPNGSAAKDNLAEPPGIKRVREFLDSCPVPWPRTAELAELAGMSVSHFHALFAREVGSSPAAYAHAARLTQARRLLRKRGATVAAAAARLGYCSGQHLAGVFRRRLGITPTQAAREPDEPL